MQLARRINLFSPVGSPLSHCVPVSSPLAHLDQNLIIFFSFDSQLQETLLLLLFLVELFQPVRKSRMIERNPASFKYTGDIAFQPSYASSSIFEPPLVYQQLLTIAIANLRQFYLNIRQEPEQARLSTGNERGRIRTHDIIPSGLAKC